MSPRSRKTTSKRSKFFPFGCLRKYCWCIEGKRARRAVDKRLYALMNVINSMEKQIDYQSNDPDILGWEKFVPFGGNVWRGDRSCQDYTETWKCNCGADNEPSRRRLFDIPALQCRSCGREANEELDFDFVYDYKLLNGIRTIRKIRQQRDGHCASYAWTAGAEIDQAIEIALEGKTRLDVKPRSLIAKDLIAKHRRYRKRIIQANKKLKKFHIDVCEDEFKMDAFELLGALVKVCGIRERGTKETHKIDSCVKIDKDNFAEICTAIADGPVIATFRAGKNIDDLVYGQVYKATDTAKFLSGNYEDEQHAVVLVGAGRRRKKKYFYFLNSWGKKFCIRISKKERFFRGGIGLIRAKDLCSDPIHLRREAKV